MERLFLTRNQVKKVIRKKEEIEKETKVKLVFSKSGVIIEGKAIDEYVAVKVINALALGFDFKIALLLEQEDYMLELIHIKDYIKPFSPSRLKQIKARIIGKQGRAIKTISQLSDCAIKLSDNTLAVIGRTDDVEIAEKALISLIRGSKHSNIYARLEKIEHKELAEEDLGLRDRE
jgi:KH domain-containing protein